MKTYCALCVYVVRRAIAVLPPARLFFCNFSRLLRLLIVPLVLLICTSAAAQDLILRKDGRAIPCRILQVDSTLIIYHDGRTGDQLYINRSEVERYIQRTVPRKPAIAVPVNAANDLLDFSAQYGRGFPRGDLGVQDLNNLQAGLALPGNMFQFMVTFKPDPWVGIGIGYRYQDFQFNKALLLAEFEKQNPGISFNQSEIGPWKISGFFARVLVSVPLQRHRRWTFDAIGMGGLPYYRYPSFRIVGTAPGFAATLTETADPVKEPALLLGGRFSFRPSPPVMLHLQADYLTGQATFAPVTSFAGVSQTYSYGQKFDAFTVSFGIALIIQKTPKQPEGK